VRMKIQFASVLLVLLVVTVLSQSSTGSRPRLTPDVGNYAGPPFKFCNKTRYKVYLAIAYFGDKYMGLVSEGWWTMKPGECKRVFDEDSYEHHRYYYAHAEDEKITWSGEVKACITNNEFTYKNDFPPSCPNGWELKGFKYFDDQNIDLTDE
jgi:uncharacterized membrane protein